MIAALNNSRNCVTVENNSLQYIWAKVRAVKAIGQTISNNNDFDDKGNNDDCNDNETAVEEIVK